jgi:hypothetical protein
MSEEIRIQESNGAPRWYNRGYFILSLLISAYFVVILIGSLFSSSSFSSSFRALYTSNLLFPLFLFCALIFAVFLLSFKFLFRIEKIIIIATVIFMVAFGIRFLLLNIFPYNIISDFDYYYSLGINFAEGNYEYVTGSYIKSFAGMAVLYGAWMKIFGTSVFVAQIGNVVITSLSCVFIYLIGLRYEKRVGIIAGLLFAIYPANWFATMIITNQNGSVLFSLIGLFFVDKALTSSHTKRAILLAVLGSLSFVVSYYLHATIIVMLIAIACFSFVRFIRIRKNKGKSIRLIVVCAITVVMTLSSTSIISDYVFVKAGLLPENMHSLPTAHAFVAGTNFESSGTYNTEDASFATSASSDEQIKLVLSRISQVERLPRLFFNKGQILWLHPDLTLFFYNIGYHSYLERTYIMEDEAQDSSLPPGSRPISDEGEAKYNSITKIVNTIGSVDSLFVIALYILMIAGILARKKWKHVCLFEIVLWNTAGWMLLRMFAEVQSRYRYQVMPYIFLLACVGIVRCIDYVGERRRRNRECDNMIVDERRM